MHSIRVKITAITLAAILTSIVSVFIACYSSIRGETDRNSVGMMNLLSQDTQKSLEKYFESIEQSVEITANIAVDSLDSVLLVECGVVRTPDNQESRTEEQNARLNEYLDAYCSHIQAYFAGVASYTQGVASYYFRIDPAISGEMKGFYYSKIGKTGFIEQPLPDIDAQGPSGEKQADWYRTTVRRGRPSWVGPYTAQGPERMWIYSYLVPIYKSGQLIGVLGMDIPCDTLVAQVRSIRVYDTGYACLFDDDGQVLYHPLLPLGSDPDDLGLSDRSEILELENSGEKLIRYEVNGESHQLSLSTLSNGMKLIITAPSSEINASWNRLARVILLISATVIVLYAVLLLLVMRVITRPLKQLTKASQRMADADYDVTLNYRGKDEIGTLTSAFQRMGDQIKRYIEDLNHQVNTDMLTGLPNMRHFFKLAEAERDRMLKEGRHPVMLYFDIIGMRHYNRQYGFEKGDRVILEFAAILARHFGENTCCRFSGDHFAAVTDEEHVRQLLQAVFRECNNPDSGMPLPVRVGIYPNRLEKVTVNVACDRAKLAGDGDRGMYACTYRYYDEEMLQKGERFRYIINNLDRALEEGWVKVYYQPIVRAANGKVCDEEALSRWIDPVMGVLSPADFISALEEAKLIYKLDLYVVDQVLEKLKRQAEAGLYLVPQSINLSRMDFDSCDIVEEICRRVDGAGINRAMLTIEITESVIGSDFDFMKEQVERFRGLGFQVWMDDFGSGYSSLDVLHNIRFDLIKFDMRFMEHFSEGDEGKIILTELARMAINLGVETVCEGVEREEQAEFLHEIGCTKIQGYYYGKARSFETMLSMARGGADLGYENPQETDYYTSIGRINLYDMAVLADEDDESLRRNFNSLPMCIIEVNGARIRYNRCNKSYRDFLKRTLDTVFTTEEMDYNAMPEGPGAVFMGAVVRCSRAGSRMLVDEKIGDGTTVHTFIRRVAVNPVTGTVAVAAAVLAVIKEGENAGTNYAHIAKALSADYVNLYYVNLETERFIEYSPDAAREDLSMERHGADFFATSRKDARQYLYKDDQEYFVSAFTRENVERALNTQGTFTLTYRLLMNGEPTYVSLKAVRMQGDSVHIIIGVSNVDAQIRQKEALARIQAEETTYSRINALMQGFICVYTVDPATGRFLEYSAASNYAGLGISREGEDFFAQAHKESLRHVYPEDIEKFQHLLTREKVMEEIGKNGVYAFQYRMILDGRPTYVSFRATLVEEQDGPQLIIGVINIDAQMRREQDYERRLSAARTRANLDTLTGVKNKTAYETMSESLARQIEDGQNVRYAIALCRVSELPQVNESQGRDVGDQLIRGVCELICNTFKHSPVFRVAGDQFAVIAQGHDYACADELKAELAEKAGETGMHIACGMARYDGKESVASVFARAEQLCRE